MDNKKSEWIYLNNKTNTERYILGESGKNIVACIGINPSTAEPNSLDQTLKKVKSIAVFNGFDGWIMYNVYPQRATDPSELDAQMNNKKRIINNGIIRQSIKHLGINTIWIAYGDLIEKRNYLPYCLADLLMKLGDLKLHWKIINNTTKKGHPRHPLYQKMESEFLDFDMETYVRNIIKPKITEFEKVYVNSIEFK
jgi:hypothetical protein